MKNKKDEFLEYVSNNYEDIVLSFKKNIKYKGDRDVIDELLNDAIIKIVEQIDNGTEIFSIKDYLFLTLKFNYWSLVRKNRQNVSRFVEIPNNLGIIDIDYTEEYDEELQDFEDKCTSLTEETFKDCQNKFGFYADLFFLHKKINLNERRPAPSIKKISEMFNIDYTENRRQFYQIRKYIRENYGEALYNKK